MNATASIVAEIFSTRAGGHRAPHAGKRQKMIGLSKRGDRAEQQNQVDEITPEAVTFSQRVKQGAVQTAPVEEQQDRRHHR